MAAAVGRGRGRSRGEAGGAAGSDAFEIAVRHLSRRPRTVAEVSRHLRERGFGEPAVRAAVKKMMGLGYLDDEALAARYAAWSSTQRPMGRARIAMELSRRGVAVEVIDKALASAFTAQEESAALQRALDKAARGAAGGAAVMGMRRIASYLLRRGFRSGDVMAAVAAWSRRAAGAARESEEDGA